MTMAGTAKKPYALLLNGLELEPWKPVGDKTMAMSWRGLEYKCACAHLGALMQMKECPVRPHQNQRSEKMNFHYSSPPPPSFTFDGTLYSDHHLKVYLCFQLSVNALEKP